MIINAKELNKVSGGAGTKEYKWGPEDNPSVVYAMTLKELLGDKFNPNPVNTDRREHDERLR
ncbi:MAG: hypothetical protein K5745_05115 [Saccharofermentans sp.]|nr:hypothetical protein [Saccharofermentans sp.]